MKKLFFVFAIAALTACNSSADSSEVKPADTPAATTPTETTVAPTDTTATNAVPTATDAAAATTAK